MKIENFDTGLKGQEDIKNIIGDKVRISEKENMKLLDDIKILQKTYNDH